MKIVNKVKFLKTIVILGAIIIALMIFSNNTYSKGEIGYKEDYIYSGDTLWNIAEYELKNNRYFENKVIFLWTFYQTCGIVGVTKEQEVTK